MRSGDETPPRVSVIIPTVGRRDVLRRCLASLAEQTHAAYEVIISDDGSPEGVDDVVAAVKQANESFDVRVVRSDVNRGANGARNAGVQASRGAILLFTDDDCVADPDWASRLEAAFDDPEVGGATGLIVDTAPRGIFDLAFKGTHRVPGPGPARRMVGGNMAVRAHLAREIGWDEAIAGCDEEGLFLTLRRAGWRVVAVPDARIVHERHFEAASFFSQAWRGGRAAARFVFRYRLLPRLDMLLFGSFWASLPLAFVGGWMALAPLCFGALALAAVLYNDLILKGKTALESALSLPIVLAYYQVRLAGYVYESIRLRLGRGVSRLERPEGIGVRT